MAKFRCTVCNWVYKEDGEAKKFYELPDTYTCPVCGSPKSAFVAEGIIKGDEGVKTNVAEKIIEQLESFGVKYIYGIPGSSNLPLIEALRKSSTITAATNTAKITKPIFPLLPNYSAFSF